MAARSATTYFYTNRSIANCNQGCRAWICQCDGVAAPFFNGLYIQVLWHLCVDAFCMLQIMLVVCKKVEMRAMRAWQQETLGQGAL